MQNTHYFYTFELSFQRRKHSQLFEDWYNHLETKLRELEADAAEVQKGRLIPDSAAVIDSPPPSQPATKPSDDDREEEPVNDSQTSSSPATPPLPPNSPSSLLSPPFSTNENATSALTPSQKSIVAQSEWIAKRIVDIKVAMDALAIISVFVREVVCEILLRDVEALMVRYLSKMRKSFSRMFWDEDEGQS